MRENKLAWLTGSRPLPDQYPRYPPIRRMLLGVTSPVIAIRIGAARDVKERMQKWSEGMEPRFISWNIAAMHTFDLSFPEVARTGESSVVESVQRRHLHDGR